VLAAATENSVGSFGSEDGGAGLIVSCCRLKLLIAPQPDRICVRFSNSIEAEAAKAEVRERATQLVAKSSAHGNALAALRAAAAEHGGSALGLHASPKAMGLNALAAVGLKCALGHGNAPESSVEI
jgi:hypothetical protein